MRISLRESICLEMMSKVLLVLIVFIFLLLIGGGIWKRTNLAVAPPIYDPISYYCKAEIVWSALAKGDLRGVLNGPMAQRPPGTAFVLYPFGFKASIQSFLFRSVLAPILIWAIALAIPIAARVSCRWDALVGSALIVGLTTMPLFYHFELNKTFSKIYDVTNQWGMVDTLEGAIGALATSLLVLGITKKSIIWSAIGWLACAFSFFIKPSGLLIMMALLGVVTVEFGVRFFGPQANRRGILKLAAAVYFIGFGILGVALWLAFSSDYMSRRVIDQAVKASQFAIAQYQGHELLAMLALLIVPVFGWWWFCPGVLFTCLVVVEAAQSVGKREWSATGVRLAAAGIILAAAICWWIFLAGQQHRYLFPFFLIVIVWFMPEIFERIRGFGVSAKGAIIGYCLVPAVLLGGLLWANDRQSSFSSY